jgi:anthranilate synthase component 1
MREVSILQIYPSAAAFQDLVQAGYNVIPVMQEYIADQLTPVSALRRLGLEKQPYAFLLESVEGGSRLGRYSFVGIKMKQAVEIWPGKLCLRDGLGEEQREFACADPLEYLRRRTAEYRLAPLAQLPRVPIGFVGYAGYELVHLLEKLPPRKSGLGLPDGIFFLPETLLAFDHAQGTMCIITNVFLEGNQDFAAYQEALNTNRELIGRLRRGRDSNCALPALSRGQLRPEQYTSNFSKEEFLSAVARATEYIAAGDIFQVVPSQRFEVRLRRSPLELYCSLRAINPSPYMFYLQFGCFGLVGSSPEVLVRLENGRAMLRPIAGTRPRGENALQDAALAQELSRDEKERAEHVMLVDLGRNDLGRVCKYGTVEATELFALERYSHVMHLVSQVEGTLAADKDQFDLFKAAFPAGTLTGAPKVRAMEIIAQLEPDARGPYGGAVGYFGFNGNMDFCITIRTVTYKGEKGWVQAGAGIVADSAPEREYQETMNKARALLQAVLEGEES